MQLAKRFLGRRLTSDAADLCFSQVACYAAGLSVLVLGFWKMGALEQMTEVQTFLGVLLVLCFSGLCVVLGHLAWVLRILKTGQE